IWSSGWQLSGGMPRGRIDRYMAEEPVDDKEMRREFGAKATTPSEDKPAQPGRAPRPQRGASPKGKRRVVIDAQAGRKPAQRRERGAPRSEPKREPEAPTGPVKVPSGITVKDLAEALGISPAKIITLMMGLGEMVTLTVSLTDDAVELIGTELNREITLTHTDDEEEEEVVFEDDPTTLVDRPPVVTIMGHVDHGKTTLLDAIRESSVVSTDAGVMPQTIEAIDHAKAANVPILVAVNKIDRPDANPDRVRTELVNQGLQPAEWGGDTIFENVSAKAKTNLEELLNSILLQADVLELKANPVAEASGVIIESRLDVGRGPVATMLVQRGTLRVGDAVVAGDSWGRVKALNDYNGKRVKDAGPGVPVEILGFDKPPPAGELCRVVEND